MTHKTIGELILTDFDAARPILEAWAWGKPLEYDNGSRWQSNGTSALFRDTAYRIPARPHAVDWSQVGERIVAFDTLSHIGHVALTVGGDTLPADLFPSFRPGTMPWEQSRIERPKEVK